ncbi:SGNH/GDSL hydrolase family protein [Candidatus Woesearchaeota archaeon]|nr:SGNH/GDSL hydrolase family protein [Candidatus Woesearchaeota archaeon]
MDTAPLRNKIQLFICTLILMFIFGEIVFRIYYSYTGRILATNEDEYCMKLNYDRLPTDKNAKFFRDFKRLGWLDDDPIIGITNKKRYYLDDYTKEIKPYGSNTTEQLYYPSARTFNSKRMNNREEFTIEKPKNASIRIALFGDSFTCGEDVPFFFGMGNMLKELIQNSEVMNFCVGGRGTDVMYARYALEAKEYKPDAVIFNVLVDDLQRPFTCVLRNANLLIVNERLVIGPRKYPTIKDFYEQYKKPKIESYLLKHTIGTYNAHTRYAKDMQHGLELFSAMLDEMKLQTKQQGTQFFATFIQENDPREISNEYYDKLKKLLKQKNVTFFDSVEYFQQHEQEYKEISWYASNKEYPRGAHFNPTGYALFAQGIKQMLENNNLIQKNTNYHFANYDNDEIMVMIPEDYTLGNTNVRIIKPYIEPLN